MQVCNWSNVQGGGAGQAQVGARVVNHGQEEWRGAKHAGSKSGF